MKPPNYKKISIGKGSNQRTVIINCDDEGILKGRVYSDITNDRPVVQINNGKRFSKNQNFQLGQVVISMHYMRTHNIPCSTLDKVLDWMIKDNHYFKHIGETHHRLNNFDNRIEALQATSAADHKHYRQSDFTLESMNLEQYVRITSTYCCECECSSYKKLGKENSFPQCRFNCKHWNSKL